MLSTYFLKIIFYYTLFCSLFILFSNSALGYDLIDFENSTSTKYFAGKLNEYGRDNTYHNGAGEWSLRLRDAQCGHSSCAYAYIEGGSGEIQFMYKNYPAYQDYILNFSLDGNENISMLPSCGWKSSGLIPINIPDRFPHRISWEYKQMEPFKSSSPSSTWIDDIQLTESLKFMKPNNNSSIEFKNESFAPKAGSLLSPFSFEVEINGIVSRIASARIELQIKNSSDDKLEIQKFMPFDGLNNKKIIFDNIRFETPGKKKYRYFLGSFSSNEFNGPEISPLIVNISPSEGSNMNPYNYSIEKFANLFKNNFNIFIDIKYSNSLDWQYSKRGSWAGDNITFCIPDLNFSEPCLGNVEYRFRTDYGIVGPFKGPYIFIIYKNIYYDSDHNSVSADVKSDRCGERICLSINGKTYSKIYQNCNNWQYLKWEDPNLQKARDFSIGSCDRY